MPLRFYRRFRAGPFRLNLSKRGVSYSVGRRGLWFTAGRRGLRTSVGIPGAGLGWYEQRRLRPPSAPLSKNGDSKGIQYIAPASILPAPRGTDWIAIAGIVAVIVATAWVIWR
jgi:Protein of unknown function (DUF4236)